jgi:hypothetical protein
MFELIIDRLEVEVAWCERIATRIEGGAPLYPEGFLTYAGERLTADGQPSTDGEAQGDGQAQGDEK